MKACKGGLERAYEYGQHVLDKYDRDIRHVTIDNTLWTNMIMTRHTNLMESKDGKFRNVASTGTKALKRRENREACRKMIDATSSVQSHDIDPDHIAIVYVIATDDEILWYKHVGNGHFSPNFVL